MRTLRFVLVTLLLAVVALGWNALVHLVLLRKARSAVAHLFRVDLQLYAGISVGITVALLVLFVWGYTRFARDRSLREASRYGLYFALVAGLLADANQFVLYPIPAWVAAAWFGAGLVEFQLYALLLAGLLPPPRS